jgi:hypothetical protein
MSQSKSILARLLATENIRVEHKNVSTAYFDLKNRVMVIPIWKTMTPHLYDLLLGHEVGHALNTPSEGWHDHVTDKNKKGFKSFLNVIEDARIEKIIQGKFPGLKTSFKKGYSDLMDMDFFGLEKMGLKVEQLSLIDKINLHCKVGSYLNIKFTEKEQYYLDKVDQVKTWDDVVALASELYEYAKTEPKTLPMEDFLEENLEDEEYGFDECDWEETDGEDDDQKALRSRQSGSGTEFDPESLTDKFFRGMEKNLIDDKVKPYVYANCPVPDLDKIIVPYKKVAKHYNSFRCHLEFKSMFSSEESLEKALQSTISQTKEALYKKFLDNNKKYIGYLVKEFELRRNARQYARASISKTGKLDMKKIHQYKLNDDLFKRMTTVPKGKSHGLVMFIDYSGSMNDNIKATIEQTIVLAVFCRKVNIPFRVYSFTDATNPDFYEDSGVVYGDVREYELRGNGIGKFSRREDDLIVDDTFFRLREYLSSEMTGNEFKEAIKFWLTSGYCFNKYWRGRMYASEDSLPENSSSLVNAESEALNGTPLNEAIISAIDITRNFRKQYRLDVVNTVFLTDGDSNDYGTKYGADGKTTYLDKYNNDYNLIIRHTETMCEGKKPPRADTTLALLELLKQVSNVNVIGYFISSYFGRGTILNRLRRLAKWENDFEAKYKKARQTKFYMINDAGYDDFYFIPGGKELEIDKDEMEVETGARKNQIKSAFMKMQKNKVINRVLLSRFVSKIA